MIYIIKDKKDKDSEKFYAYWDSYLKNYPESDYVIKDKEGQSIIIKVPSFKLLFTTKVEVYEPSDKENENPLIIDCREVFFSSFKEGYYEGVKFFNTNYNPQNILINPELYYKQICDVFDNGVDAVLLPPSRLKDFRPRTLSHKSMQDYGYLNALYTLIKNTISNNRKVFEEFSKTNILPFNKESYEIFKYLDKNWNYKSDLRWAYIYSFLLSEVQPDLEEPINKRLYQNFIREKYKFQKPFNFDNANSKNTQNELKKILKTY